MKKKALVTIILKKSSTTKTNKHTASGYSFLHIVCSMQKKKTLFFQEIKMKKICKDLKKDETEIINYDDTMSIKNVIKSEIIVIILENTKELLILFVI